VKNFLTFFSLLIIINTVNAQQSNIKIIDAWVRPSAEGSNTALFFILENNGDKPDTLLSAESSVADIVEIHETYKKDNDKMGMREVKFVAVPAKSKVELKPRGLHVMLIDLQKDLRIGDKVEATIKLIHAGKIKINAIVKDMPAMNMRH
jgi:copper(I)-binding protein